MSIELLPATAWERQAEDRLTALEEWRENLDASRTSDPDNGADKHNLNRSEPLVQDRTEHESPKPAHTESLVDRVAGSFLGAVGMRAQARAAIREVADALEDASRGSLWMPRQDALAWIRSQGGD